MYKLELCDVEDSMFHHENIGRVTMTGKLCNLMDSTIYQRMGAL